MYFYRTEVGSATGLTRATGTVAWTYTAYGTITTGIDGTIEITGLTYMTNLAGSAALYDTTHEALIELAQGTGTALMAQVPYSWRIDTGVNHLLHTPQLNFTEPIQVAPNTAIYARAAQSLATAITYSGVKIFYRRFITPQDPPTVTLNSPSDTSNTTDTTPLMDFTGTDINSNDITYQIQIDTVNTFNSQGGSATDTGFNLTTTTQSNYWTNATNAFTSNDSYANTVDNVSVEWYHGFDLGAEIPVGATITGIEVKIEANAATTNGSPLGVRLSWDSGTSNNGTTVTNTFDTGADQEKTYGGSGDTWGRTWSRSEFNSNRFWVRVGQGTSGQALNVDAISVKVYYTTAALPLIQEYSEVNAGFSNPDVGGDTDPFISGDNIQFQVGSNQAALFASPTETDFASTVTTMAVNMPSTVEDGDLLIALVHVRNAGTWTKPTGWNDISSLSQAGGGSVGKLDGFYKIADGTEGGTTATWTASTGTTGAWQVIRIRAWHGTTPPEAATSSGDSSSADPPNLTPSWGSLNTLWLAIAGHSAISEAAFTAAPTDYSGFSNNGASTGGAAVSLASAYRALLATSENPGTFTAGGSNRYWASATIAIRPKTFTSELSLTTYYWRVRGKDPAGSNTWGAWSSTRSFTVVTSGGAPTKQSLLMLMGVA